tara:strand:- start:1726 stop:1860 length:135 start_codon:yes stop_codon:yes gene_type:complete
MTTQTKIIDEDIFKEFEDKLNLLTDDMERRILATEYFNKIWIDK